jgi:SAM dependent carboxyl methyltransferase
LIGKGSRELILVKNIAPAPSAMQGDGYYNRNSRLQAANLASALPLLQEAADLLALKQPAAVTFVDYGSSQGRNSMLPLSLAIGALRNRQKQTCPVEVFHVDLPDNDFNSLFAALDNPAESYLTNLTHVFPAAIGKSYFEQVLPPDRVDIGWSSNALHWLRGSPVHVSDHGWAIFSEMAGAAAAVDRQLASDWREFLIARAAELRDGGVVVCQFMGRGEHTHGFEWMAGCWWQAIVDVHREGLITDEDMLHMTCPSAGRSAAQIELPFATGPFHGLLLDQLAVVASPDPFWEAYLRSGDVMEFARSWSTTMRAANGPSFTAGLSPERDRDHILDMITQRHAARVAADPQPSISWLAIAVIKKPDVS